MDQQEKREALFENLETQSTPKTRDIVTRAPFNYPGGKSRSVNKILARLPERTVYVEPFGGSGVILLNRLPSKLDVFNDIFSGVVCFYRCIRDVVKLERLIELMEHTIHSREEWVWCKETWQDESEEVERAFKWYYMVSYSFGGLSRNFGRSTSGAGCLGGKFRNRIKGLYKIHERFKRVQVENQDWERCISDYDSPETVFYLDPPYVDADTGVYKHILGHNDHRHLLDVIFSLQGFVAISGYSNPLYDERDWDEEYGWDSFISIQSISEHGNKSDEHNKRGHAKEKLWIKTNGN